MRRGAPAVEPGTVHLGLWRLADASRRWALSSPYDPKLVDAVKTIPGRARGWIPEAKVWLVEREYVETLRGFLGRLYWETAFCQTCWAGETCPRLAELAGVAGATVLRSKLPAPSPPWPIQPPKTVEEAAELFGLPVDADPAAIKKRFRKLSLEAHPDVAGAESAARMRAIIAARDLLNSVHHE